MSTNPPDDKPVTQAAGDRPPPEDGGEPLNDPHQETVLFERQDTVSASTKKQAGDRPLRIGRYEIRGTLGQGAFGTVYLGFDSQLGRRVAIKVPRQNLSHIQSERFLQEARRVAQLRHPGIVAVFDVGEFDNRCCIVSDYVEGKSLSEWLSTTAYTWADAVRIVADLADALGHAHQHGTVHRDVKPTNVMIMEDGRPILLDFGLAISDLLEDRELPGIVAGTPSYMSPEQARGRGHRIDGRTDIYSVGVLLYHMVTGKLPFRSKDKLELLRQICDDEPQPIRQVNPDVPEELARIAAKAMSKKTADRYSTSADLAAELRSLLASVPPAAGESSPQSVPAAAATHEPPSSQRHDSRLSEAERRQVTAVFCEIDESALDEELDPEEVRDLQLEVQRACSKMSSKHGGYIARTETDGLLIYFGYPESYEDAVHRAIRSALSMLDFFRQFEQKLSAHNNAGLEFRIGIHTGIAVTEESEGSESGSQSRYSVVGGVPKVASGIARLAESGTVVVSPTVRRIIGDDFEIESIGEKRTKGVSQPIELFVVRRELKAGEIVVRKTSHQSPLLGREHELAILEDAWHKAAAGHGQVAYVAAPAGVGKSRLTAAFRDQIDATSQQLETNGSAYHRNSPMHPVVELFSRIIGVDDDDSPELKLERLETFAQDLDVPVETVVPVLADLLSIPAGGAYPAFSGSPERRKQHTLEVITELIFALSERRPTLLIVEDLHWIDPTTLELIGVLIEHCVNGQLLLLLTFRPSFTVPWPMRSHICQLAPSPLPDDLTRQLTLAVTGGRPLPDEVVNHIRKRTDGVPLYVEEMTKAVLESGILVPSEDGYQLNGPIESLSIPETLNDSLMARLDRLGQARDVAQLGSIVGREFTYQLLLAASDFGEDVLKSSLKALVDAELLHQRGFFPRARFSFKHALIQDAAYESLLKSTRQEWHGRIADVLREQFPEICQTQPELLANHYTQAGRFEEAIPLWTQAGQQAQEQCAHLDAVHHFRAALAAIATIEDPGKRELLEFQQQIPLGVSLISAKGYANPECGPVFARARELAKKFGDPISQFYILWGSWAWRNVREDFDICMQLSEEAFEMEIVHQDDGIRMEAEFIPGHSLFYLGEFERAQEHCAYGLSLYDEERCRQHAQHTGQNSAVTIGSYVSLNHWMFGYPEQALAVMDEVVQRARKMKDPYSLVFGIHHWGWLHHYLRIAEPIIECAAEEMDIAIDQQFVFWIAEANLCRGYGEFLQGKLDEAIDSLKLGIGQLAKTGARLSFCQFYSNLAEALLAKGRREEALESIEMAIAATLKNNNAFHRAEIYRLHGEILRSLDAADDDVEAAFQESLNVARRQSAKGWELRTATSLARFRKDRGRTPEALDILRPVISWFTEGTQFADHVDAWALCEELKAS